MARGWVWIAAYESSNWATAETSQRHGGTKKHKEGRHQMTYGRRLSCAFVPPCRCVGRLVIDRNFLRAIHDHNIDRTLARFQSQSQLLLNSGYRDGPFGSNG